MLAVAYWLISPIFINKKVSEEMPSVGNAAVEEIARGEFMGLAGHQARGTAKLLKVGYKYIVRLEEDFKVTNGPDLFVHLGKNGEYDPKARLGNLKGNEGSQNYEIPANINPLNYNEIWVWCRSFNVAFGKAGLK